MMQKQQVRKSNAATTAMAIRAQGGTVGYKDKRLTWVFVTKEVVPFCQIKRTWVPSRKQGCTAALLTWDFIYFVQEFALDLLKHVVLADLCVVGAGGVRHRGGDEGLGGRRGGGGDTGGFGGRHGLCLPEQVELHCQRLGAGSLRHTDQTEGRDNIRPKKIQS